MANGSLAYTRAGQFQLNREGNLVDANGNLLQPPITLPQNAQSITIATDGTVSYNLPNQTASQSAGQIQLATFINPAGLNSLGQNLYQPTNASGDPVIGNPGGQEGHGNAAARLYGTIQRERGGRVHQPDRQPARL